MNELLQRLTLLPVWDSLDSLCRLVRSENGRALLVGGCVRDLLLERESKDFDVEVFGIEPDRLIELLSGTFNLDLVGRDFGVIKLKDLPVDVSIPRRENKRGLGHQGFEIHSDPTMTVTEAAERRDFTINALSLDPLTCELFDPFNGQADLRDRILRPVSERTFADDPLRVLRAAQFLARFELTPSVDLFTSARKADIEGLPKERLFEEFKKLLLKGVRPSLGLNFLHKVGWLRFFPELEAMLGCQQDGSWHPEGDCWVHSLHCVDAFAASRIGNDREDLVVGLAVLCHDLGKPATTEFLDGRWRSRGHEPAGEAPTRSFLARLTNDADLVDEVVVLVVEHLKPFDLFEDRASDSAIRRLAQRVKRVDRLVRVALCDRAGRPPLVSDDSFAPWLLERVEDLGVKDQASRPIVMGRHLIDLGWEPGKHFRRVLDACFEAQLDGTFDDERGGLAFLKGYVTALEDKVDIGEAKKALKEPDKKEWPDHV